VEGRVRPIRNAFDQPVFYRVEMNILDVAGEVSLVAYRVLPIALLPKRVFAACFAWSWRTCGRDGNCKTVVDMPPPFGKAVVTLRQSQDRVKMVGENDDCLDFERGFRARVTHRRLQRGDVIDQS